VTVSAVDLPLLRSVNQSAAFNQWAGFEVIEAEPGRVELRLPWRPEFGQYAGFLHAGLVAALIDTACGFVAATATGGDVVASHCAVSFLAPARGEAFVGRALVVKAGRRQVFTSADVFAELDGSTTLVACGQTILVPTGAQQ
jgi:uncharacterized protein (TIGR00369 family)